MTKGLTKPKLLKFIKIRNKSPYNSNLQFSIDADSCGIKLEDLGEVKKLEDGYGWEWDTEFGKLQELLGKLRLVK